jgi:DNA-binding transcriptional ArsR family regulator
MSTGELVAAATLAPAPAQDAAPLFAALVDETRLQLLARLKAFVER